MHSQPGIPAAIRQRWGLATPSSRGPRARLGLDDVVAAGVELADAEGLAGVTLARVAGAVGVTTTGLYRYVDTKDTLVELMVDAALGAPPPQPDADPRERIARWADALWGRYAAHPWLATMPPAHAPRLPHSFAWLEQAVACLSDLTVAEPVATAIAADVMIRGYAALSQADGRQPDPETAQAVARRFPRLATAPASDPATELRTMLARLLD